MKTFLFLLCCFSAATATAESADTPETAAAPQGPQFRLMYPNYRGWIMPDGPAVSVLLTEPGMRHPVVRLAIVSGGRSVNVTDTLRKPPYRLEIPHGAVPAGSVTLTAQLLDDQKKVLREQSWPLKKLAAQEVAALTSYVDASNNLIVEGKPFFPIGWYTNRSDKYMREVADSPFNTLLAYGTNHEKKSEMLAFLDEMHSRGMKLIYCMNDVYPGAKYNIEWEGVTGNENVAAAALDAYKNHPAVLAWYLNDELPREMAPDLERYYDMFKTRDPRHPCFIVLCNKKDFPFLQQTADIVGGDPYPIPHSPIMNVAQMLDGMNESTMFTKPSWFVPQAFAWYQYKSENKDRGHTPTEQELRIGRAPTYEEERCMTYLGLVHGAKGLIYYCYYDMRLLPQYDEMWTWMKKIAGEVKELSPVLLSPDDLGPVKITPKGSPIQTKLKRHNGRLYMLAVNPVPAETNAKFRVPCSRAQVMFEGRTINGGPSFTDHFQSLAVHVYDLGTAKR